MPQGPDDLRHLLLLGGIGAALGMIFAALARVALHREGGVRGWTSGLAAGAIVGALTTLGLRSIDLELGWKAVVLGIGSCIASDIVHGIDRLGSHVRNDPVGVLRAIVASLRGGKR